MKKWDLISPNARLELANRVLMETWRDVQGHWDDSTSAKFHKQYLDSLQPRAKRAMEAIKRLNEVFAAAERALESD